ncbi:MAG: hypothetical protein ACTSRG_25075 [Candidatus Helarchaeota archaeon]
MAHAIRMVKTKATSKERIRNRSTIEYRREGWKKAGRREATMATGTDYGKLAKDAREALRIPLRKLDALGKLGKIDPSEAGIYREKAIEALVQGMERLQRVIDSL